MCERDTIAYIKCKVYWKTYFRRSLSHDKKFDISPKCNKKLVEGLGMVVTYLDLYLKKPTLSALKKIDCRGARLGGDQLGEAPGECCFISLR